MKNRLLVLGILVMVLVFGMAVAGCSEEEDNGQFTIRNDCDEYSITEISIRGGSGTDIKENVTLTKGQSKSYTLSNGDYKYSVDVTFTGEGDPPVIRNGEVLTNRSQTMQFGIDYKCALSDSRGISSQEPGSYFSWAYN